MKCTQGIGWGKRKPAVSQIQSFVLKPVIIVLLSSLTSLIWSHGAITFGFHCWFFCWQRCVNIEYLLDSWLGQNACCILRRQEVCLTMLNSTWCDSHWLDSDKVNWPCIVQKCPKDFSHLLASSRYVSWSGGSKCLWTTSATLRHFDTSTPCIPHRPLFAFAASLDPG